MPYPTQPQDGDDHYYDVVNRLTAEGKRGQEIADVVGKSRDWVHRYRVRNGIVPLPHLRGRPRKALNAPARPGQQRPEDVPPNTYPVFEWRLPPEWRLSPDSKAILVLAPLRAAQPVSADRRLTFDYEDTGEL